MPLLHESPNGTPPWKPGDDARESQNVATATNADKPIAPGFHNPTIPRDRFEPGPTRDHIAEYPKPKSDFIHEAADAAGSLDGIGALMKDSGKYLELNVQQMGGNVERTAADLMHRRTEHDPQKSAADSTSSKHEDLTRVPGEPIHVERAGSVGEYKAGSYSQSGRITEIDGDRVVQNIGRGTATYSLAELRSQSQDPAATEASLRRSLQTQTQVNINFGKDGFVSATDLGHQIGRAQSIEQSR